jgi:hypothetical protein
MRNPLDEIAILVQSLSYGEMIELAEAVCRSRPEGSAVSEEELPVLLYCWAIARLATSETYPAAHEEKAGAFKILFQQRRS